LRFDTLKIGVLGTGTWGTALGRLLSNAGHDVMMWSPIDQEIRDLSTKRVHKNLPGMVIPDAIIFTGNLEEACRQKDIIVFAVPSVFVRNTAVQAKPYIPDNQLIVDVAKGIEPDTLLTMTGILQDVLQGHQRLVALSGPTHAEEVALDLLTTIVSASRD
jgi:glycerol-3-phosphate dehydrogenase (NAD(P)+)